MYPAQGLFDKTGRGVITMTWHEIGHQEASPFQINNLKICELCGSLNLNANRECFVCGWHGKFNKRPEVVRIAMELMERKLGKLDLQQLTSPCAYKQSSGSLAFRIKSFGSKLRKWLFG